MNVFEPDPKLNSSKNCTCHKFQDNQRREQREFIIKVDE